MTNLISSKINTKQVKVTNIDKLSKEELTNYINSKLSDSDKEFILSNIIKDNEEINSNCLDNNVKETSNVHYCNRCHKKITDPSSIRLGMGTTCYKKWLSEICIKHYKKLF